MLASHVFWLHLFGKNDWLPVVVLAVKLNLSVHKRHTHKSLVVKSFPALEVNVFFNFLKSYFHVFSSKKNVKTCVGPALICCQVIH